MHNFLNLNIVPILFSIKSTITRVTLNRHQPRPKTINNVNLENNIHFNIRGMS